LEKEVVSSWRGPEGEEEEDDDDADMVGVETGVAEAKAMAGARCEESVGWSRLT
jgi:hypothetical protein